MTHGSLFSGIGGFDLAAEWCGWVNTFQVEIDPFCQRVLQKNFPNASRFTDIREFDGTQFRGTIDVLSGGFPCQPYSVAGQRRGASDDRALWPEMLRVVGEIQPTWVVGENVAGIRSMGLENMLSELETVGYQAATLVIPACAVGAVHRRDRVWILAHANRERQQQPEGVVRQIRGRPEHSDSAVFANSVGIGREKRRLRSESVEDSGKWHPAADEHGDGSRRYFGKVAWQPNSQSQILRTAYGLPGRVDRRGKRIRALGNAIVPQVAYQIFKSINDLHFPQPQGNADP